MSFKEKTLQEYIDLLGAKKSIPGGGSCLAVCLQFACSLCQMVINFTIEKKGYEKYQSRIKELGIEIDHYSKMASSLADEDSLSYQSLMLAFKTKDKEQIALAAKRACEVPYSLYLLTEQVEEVARELFVKGNKNVIPDAKIAADLCCAIYPGCRYNIEANIVYIEDKEFIDEMLSILE